MAEATSTNGTAPLFVIEDLHVAVEDKEILKGLSLVIRKGEVHALMGPNGSGKSTLAYALMGHPKYRVTQGAVALASEDILKLPPHERARRGLFLAFQYPMAVPGVTQVNFLRAALKSVKGRDVPLMEFRKVLLEKMKLLKIEPAFVQRYVNEGFSGGEKKRAEILQLGVLEPRMAVLDETDSGLDIDALRVVSDGVNSLLGPEVGALVITHYQRLLNYIQPHYVHVLIAGKIVRSGGRELALELEQKGYDWLIPGNGSH